LRLSLVGADPNADVVGLDELPGKSNYFIGNDPKKWRTNVPTYARVKYKDVYPGVDLVYYGNQGQLEYDFVVKPGGDPMAVRLAVAAMSPSLAGGRTPRLEVDATGDLVIATGDGKIRFLRPVVYQPSTVGPNTGNPDRKYLDGRYVLKGEREVGFELASYDRRKPLVIDPVLSYSSYLGGSGQDDAHAIAVDSAGNAYVTGGTVSVDFPTTAGAFQTAFGGAETHCTSSPDQCGDAFVAKVNSAGTALIYSTYLGGSDADFGNGIAVDASGNAYITGQTNSSNFPTTPGAFQTTFGGGTCGSFPCPDAFVTKLNATGSALLYSTYIGGSGYDYGSAIAVDSGGDAYVTGGDGPGFPTTSGAFQTTFVCCSFITKINSGGSALVYSTYLGGSNGGAWGAAIAVDSSGNAYVTGDTNSTDFPTAGPFQAAFGGNMDAYVTKLNASGSALVYSTYLGGSGYDAGLGIGVDSAGNAYVAGQTTSTNFPTLNGFQDTYPGGSFDSFVAKLNPAGSALVYSTYLGGSWGNNNALAMMIDTSGDAYVTGFTEADDFPIANAIQTTHPGSQDMFITELNPSGNGLVFSTFLGGAGSDSGAGISVDSAGNIYVAGHSGYAPFPVTFGVLQPNRRAQFNAVVLKIAPQNSPNVSLYPGTLVFLPQKLGTTSPLKTVTLTNVGTAALTIDSITTSGDFLSTNDCGGSVPGASSCSISVAYRPSVTNAIYGQLTINDDALSGSVQTVNLSALFLMQPVTEGR
jgi:hypothetical protein